MSVIEGKGPVTGSYTHRYSLFAMGLVALLMFSIFPLSNVGAEKETISVFTPNGGETLIAGGQYTLRWTISNSGGYIAVSYSTSGGESYENIDRITNSPSHGYGWIEWTIPPNLNSTSCLIKVVWVDSLFKPYTVIAEDVSDSNFTIEPGVSMTITDSPDLVSYGRYHYLKWNLYDPHEMVSGLIIDWRIDDGSGWSSWGSLSSFYDWYDPNMGYIWWTLPNYIQSGYGQIRIQAMSNGNVTVLATDTTDTFDIVSPGVTLIQPDGGVTLVAGTTYTIKWRTSLDPEEVIVSVQIDYSTNGGSTWNGIIGGTANDFEQDWTVPSIATTQLKIRVISQYGEWYYLDEDVSSGMNTIILNSNIPSVTLIDPSPPVDGGVVIGSGETYQIVWSLTGYSSITGLKLEYSTNNGSTYNLIVHYISNWAIPYNWVAPAVDTYEARIRVTITASGYSNKVAVSNHAFYIFDTIAFNRPPIAMAGPDQTATEGTLIYLDGSASYDQDGDTLIYNWTQISPSAKIAALNDRYSMKPIFTSDLEDYQVTYIFELKVTDGFEHSDPLLFNTDRVSVVVNPIPPEITSFTPDTGWTGTDVTIYGNNLKGAEIVIDGQVVAIVPREPDLNFPDPDHTFKFTIFRELSNGSHHIVARTSMGEISSVDEIDIFPVPQWLYDNAIGFQNNHTNHYSYPWNPGGSGVYRDVFGNQVYLNLWICIGLPYWTPWSGWGCLGYEIEQPFAPDPFAAILYAAAFDDIGEDGECFGMSTSTLEYYHNKVDEDDYGQTVTDWDELVREGDFLRHIRMRQGAQISAEILHSYLGTLINGLVPSSDYTGMGLFIKAVKLSIDTGELGIMSLIDGGGHAVVPYAYEDRDGKTYFYVYDSNRPGFKDPAGANWQAQNGDNANDSPPVVVIDRSGTYWDWSFEWPDGSTWGDDIGIGFVPYSSIVGDRTIPTSITGIIDLLVGSATFDVEDENGNRSGVDENGEIVWGIEGAAPLPFFGGPGDLPDSYFLPVGNYTTHISGTETGIYNWSVINNGTSAFQVENAEVNKDSNDTVELNFPEGNPYLGEMVYSSDDDMKVYDGGFIHNYGPSYRTFKIKGAELSDDGEHGDGIHSLKATPEYDGLIFTNLGGGPTTFDVEFSTNVMSEEVWNGSERPETGFLPTATRSGITVGPGETVVLRPSKWCNLTGSIVILEGETVPGIPTNLTIVQVAGQVELGWNAPEIDGGWPVVGYYVFRDNGSGVMELIAIADGTSIVDMEVQRGIDYNYSVRAFNAIGEGEMSPSVQIIIPLLTAPSSPTDLSAVYQEGKVALSWGEPEDDGGNAIFAYIIFKGAGTGPMENIAELGMVNEFEDADIQKNETYRYQVVAVNDIGQGVRTEEVSISIPADQPTDDDDTDDDDGDGGGDEENGNSWLLYLIIGVIVVVGIIILLVFMTSRGKKEEEYEE